MKYNSSENWFKFLNLVIKERKMKFTLSQVSDKKKKKQNNKQKHLIPLRNCCIDFCYWWFNSQIFLLSYT